GRGPPPGWVQGPEQGVRAQHPGPGEAAQQGGLAGVGVARARDGGALVALAVGALGVTPRGHRLALAPQLGHPVTDAAAVQLDLRLAGAARAHPGTGAADLAAGLAGHRLAPAA